MHERRDDIPTGFTHRGAAHPDERLKLFVGLAQNDITGLEERLMAVSTPSNPEYGRYLSKEEAEVYVRPSSDTLATVHAYLSANGIAATQYSAAGDIVTISVTVAQANDFFATNFGVFEHEATRALSIRALNYSLPLHMTRHIEWVHPITTDVPASCATVVTPACLQAIYGIPSTPATQPSNRLGVPGFVDFFANQADLSTFLAKYRPDIPSNTSFALETLDGGRNDQNLSLASREAYTVGLATNVPVTFISVGLNFTDGIFGFHDVITYLLAQSNPPQTLSTSYGTNESTTSPAVLRSLCNAYMQLGARGTTIIFGSGDGGVEGLYPDPSCTTFRPTAPAGCPWITSVGATTSYPERAANFSGGGFSNLFPRPSYQSAAVEAYLSRLGSTNAGLYNASGRAFPDIAALGDNVQIEVGGEPSTIYGTSCSGPIVASMVALLNDELVARGRPTLGFLNPLLYSIGADAFNDITEGSNPGCGTDGFPAMEGWDPITGLGTPNYPALRKAVGL
ncbi:family S53 protease [Vararia minispora EC-137]|uniref:Family S53 protease n=1 Tax=Vararia minispora EC-137 TaxID=1314806 RepID=A0ACB8QBM1_9AGAM|nr:family S53 protease [Vararia minispora EC-137]